MKTKRKNAKIKPRHSKRGVPLFSQSDLLKHYIFMTFRVDQELPFTAIYSRIVLGIQFYKMTLGNGLISHRYGPRCEITDISRGLVSLLARLF